MRQTGASRHIPVLLATTFLVVGTDAGVLPAAAQEQTAPQAARDANAQAITLDTINVQGDAGRTDGYVANSTSVATKTNTPLINIPQSIYGRDQGFHQGPEFPEPHRRHALRSRRRRASGRRQPRRARHSRRGFKRELLRQRLS